MADIAIKEEKPDFDELQQIPSPKGGGSGGGQKTAQKEKKQAALRVISDAKQKMNYRLKDWLPQPTMSLSNVAPPAKRATNGLILKGMNTTQHRLRLPMKNNNGGKCGEIFVTNNAKKWTFVCTFCQKSTRDIGEFVCHIKFKHMGGAAHYDDDNEEEEEDDNEDEANVNSSDLKDQHNTTMDESYNQGQDQYFDYAKYLDVNVHTEDSDEPSYKSQAKATKPVATKNGNDVVNLLDDEDDDAHNESSLFDYDYEGPEDDEAILIDDIDHSGGGGDGGDGEDQRPEDDDQLLLRRSLDDDSNMDDLSGGGSIKKYRSHVRGTAYCKLCDKTFQYYSLYRNHMIKHSNVTPFKCQFCSKGFKSKQAIRYHMKTHSKEKQFQCPVCPTSYATSNLFMTHVLSHESETCFPCMVCAKVLKTEQEREEHLEAHSEDRPYSCSFCSKRFRQKHHLSNHLKLHCQYRCDFCRESFTSTQTQRRPYACPTCEETPDIRKQVERQRSLSMKPVEAAPPPMEFENVMIDNEDVTAPECVDLDEMASDDDDGSEEGGRGSTSLLVSTTSSNCPQCKYCLKTFTHTGALNFHIRQIHGH